MRTAIEEEDIRLIADAVVRQLRPLLSNINKKADDSILDVKGLCEYLKVTPKWVYERTHLKEIPHYKLSNKQLRFKKRDIDTWLEAHRTQAINGHKVSVGF